MSAANMDPRSILRDAAEGRAIVHPWTVDLYHRALAEGLEESTAFELLDGFIVRKDRAKAGEDLGVKLQMYARAGIEQYVVVDLVHDVVLDHRHPSGDEYRELTSLRTGGDVELRAGHHTVSVPVSHLLP